MKSNFMTFCEKIIHQILFKRLTNHMIMCVIFKFSMIVHATYPKQKLNTNFPSRENVFIIDLAR